MKKIIIILSSLLLSITTYGQLDNNLMKSNWRQGKEKEVFNNTIIRHEGKNNIDGVTNIGYQTINQVINNIEEKAESEMWTDEKKNKTIEYYNKFASGGLVHLYIKRLTIDAANTKMFTLIIKDSEDNTEIYRKELKSDIPNRPTRGDKYWWNYKTISIPEKTDNNFFIYVIDKIGGDNNKFKFEVKL